MNKKGFTVIEVVVSFGILAVVMLVVITFMITYRDKVKNAEVETQLLDYKNTLTKIIYDEIILGNYISVDPCNASEAAPFKDAQCAFFIDSDGARNYIGIKELTSKQGSLSKGLYLFYANNYYLLPDSDLNAKKTDRSGRQYEDNMCEFIEFKIDDYLDRMHALKISYYHHGLDKRYDIILVIN